MAVFNCRRVYWRWLQFGVQRAVRLSVARSREAQERAMSARQVYTSTVCWTSLHSGRNLRGPHVARQQQMSINNPLRARARPQQQTRRSTLLLSIDGTDWRTLDLAAADTTHLRSANRHLLAVPRFRLNTYGRRAFSVAGPMAWNSLPDFLF